MSDSTPYFMFVVTGTRNLDNGTEDEISVLCSKLVDRIKSAGHNVKFTRCYIAADEFVADVVSDNELLPVFNEGAGGAILSFISPKLSDELDTNNLRYPIVKVLPSS